MSVKDFKMFSGFETGSLCHRLLKGVLRKVSRTFRDGDEPERGENIVLQLHEAIKRSMVSMIILSKDYAYSWWWPNELAEILERWSSRYSVIRFFNDVNPSDLRNQIGSLKEVFRRHERRIETEMGELKEYLKGKVQYWRMALKEVANFTGLEFSKIIFEADESHIIQRVRHPEITIVRINNRPNPCSEFWYNVYGPHLKFIRPRGKQSRDEIPSHVFSLNILQQHFGNKREDVAKSLGISVSTLKRHCRYRGISRWPNQIRNNAVYSEIEAARGSSKRVFQLEGQTTQSTNREGISSHVFSLDILQPHFGSKRKDAAKSLGISESTLKRICRNHGIPRWPNQIRSSVSGLHIPYGEKNPLPTFNTLSTNGQIQMENEVGGQNLEPDECLTDSFEVPNFQNTRIGSIAEFDKTPTLSDSVPDHCRDANFCISAVYWETEAAGGSSESVFQLQGQTTQSTAYSNRNALVFPQPQIASEEVLNESGGSSEDWRDLLASQAETILEGNVSEFTNSTFLACYDAAALYQTFATIPNELPRDYFEEPSFYIEHDSIVGTTPTYHDSFLINHHGVDFCFSSVHNELEGQTTQFPACPTSNLSPLQIAPTEVLSGNMGSSEDSRILLASQEALLEGHVFESNNLTVPSCPDAAAPTRLLANNIHTMPTYPHKVPHLIGGSSESTYPNHSGLVDPPHPQRASTQIPSENMGTLEDLSESINPTIPSCSNPTPSQQLMMPPLIASQDTNSVRVKATNWIKTIAFNLSFASGIIQLKEEMSKRSGFELGNFNLQYKDEDGDWVSIDCDDDVRDYLQLLTSNQVSILLVS